jgi:predicted Zn-dependent peptidase
VLYEDAGYWCAYASAAKKMSVRVAETLFRELRRLLKDGMSEAEIDAAKEHLCGEEIISEEDMEYRMKRLMRNHLNGFECASMESTLALIRDIGHAELDTLLKGLLDFGRLAFVVYGPKLLPKTKEAIKALAGY